MRQTSTDVPALSLVLRCIISLLLTYLKFTFHDSAGVIIVWELSFTGDAKKPKPPKVCNLCLIPLHNMRNDVTSWLFMLKIISAFWQQWFLFFNVLTKFIFIAWKNPSFILNLGQKAVTATHKDGKVTAIQWDDVGGRLFVGDSNGKISVLNVAVKSSKVGFTLSAKCLNSVYIGDQCTAKVFVSFYYFWFRIYLLAKLIKSPKHDMTNVLFLSHFASLRYFQRWPSHTNLSSHWILSSFNLFVDI